MLCAQLLQHARTWKLQFERYLQTESAKKSVLTIIKFYHNIEIDSDNTSCHLEFTSSDSVLYRVSVLCERMLRSLFFSWSTVAHKLQAKEDNKIRAWHPSSVLKIYFVEDAVVEEWFESNWFGAADASVTASALYKVVGLLVVVWLPSFSLPMNEAQASFAAAFNRSAMKSVGGVNANAAPTINMSAIQNCKSKTTKLTQS